MAEMPAFTDNIEESAERCYTYNISCIHNININNAIHVFCIFATVKGKLNIPQKNNSTKKTWHKKKLNTHFNQEWQKTSLHSKNHRKHQKTFTANISHVHANPFKDQVPKF